MAGFKFSLQTLLNHRLHREEILQKELAEAGCRLKEEKAALTRLQEDKERAYAEVQLKHLRGMAVSEHILYANFLEGLARNIAVQQEKVNEAERQYAQKQEELIEAVKKRKTIENLKEKGLAAYSKKLLKLDQDFLDEVAICRFHKGTP